MNIVRGLKAAAKALVTSKAESFRAGGKLVECPHCGNVLFRKRKASLNDWTDVEACVLVCANCSRIQWYFDDLQPEA